MFGSLSSFRRRSLHCLTLALVANGALATATPPPAWWIYKYPPVLVPNAAPASENNHGVANVGQAKWAAKNAVEALRRIWPVVADEIEADLTTGSSPILTWAAPITQEEKDKQRAPLLVGQLKAIAAPFYTRLNARAATWLGSERTAYGILLPGTIYPWAETSPVDGSNKSFALIGQLKAVFSLDFTADRETGPAADGLPDLWEYRFFGNLTATATGDSDNDGLTNEQEYLMGNNPTVSDTEPLAAAAGLLIWSPTE